MRTTTKRLAGLDGLLGLWLLGAPFVFDAPTATEMTAEEYEPVTDVTYLGYVHGTQSALDRMRPRDEGTIVQVGSALAYRGIPLQSAYCGAKHAIQGFTESVRTELIHDDSDVQLSMVQMRDRTGYRRNAVSSGSGSAPTQAATSATAFVSKTK